VTDPFQLGRDLAADLRTRSGPRLVDVVVFGSQVTGEATEDSDLDVAVVLRDVRSPWEDGRRMDDAR
jgi:predicted nucleotidyltransferase